MVDFQGLFRHYSHLKILEFAHINSITIPSLIRKDDHESIGSRKARC
jgi:hypothetical protein